MKFCSINDKKPILKKSSEDYLIDFEEIYFSFRWDYDAETTTKLWRKKTYRFTRIFFVSNEIS